MVSSPRFIVSGAASDLLPHATTARNSTAMPMIAAKRFVENLFWRI